MKILLVLFVCMLLSGCWSSPEGRWEAVERVEVYRNDDSFKVVFYISRGEVCSISPRWEINKAAAYKKVVCEKGVGWIMDDRFFKKIN